MYSKKCCKYFLGSLRSSFLELFVSLILFILANAFLVLFPGLSENQMVSLLVGVVSGIIATLILSITGKYADSKRAYETIHASLSNIISEAKYCVKHKGDFSNKIVSWEYKYIDMCRESIALTYKKDFEEVSIAMKKLVSCSDWQNFEEVIEKLEQARKVMFE